MIKNSLQKFELGNKDKDKNIHTFISDKCCSFDYKILNEHSIQLTNQKKSFDLKTVENSYKNINEVDFCTFIIPENNECDVNIVLNESFNFSYKLKLNDMLIVYNLYNVTFSGIGKYKIGIILRKIK